MIELINMSLRKFQERNLNECNSLNYQISKIVKIFVLLSKLYWFLKLLSHLEDVPCFDKLHRIDNVVSRKMYLRYQQKLQKTLMKILSQFFLSARSNVSLIYFSMYMVIKTRRNTDINELSGITLTWEMIDAFVTNWYVFPPSDSLIQAYTLSHEYLSHCHDI